MSISMFWILYICDLNKVFFYTDWLQSQYLLQLLLVRTVWRNRDLWMTPVLVRACMRVWLGWQNIGVCPRLCVGNCIDSAKMYWKDLHIQKHSQTLACFFKEHICSCIIKIDIKWKFPVFVYSKWHKGSERHS